MCIFKTYTIINNDVNLKNDVHDDDFQLTHEKQTKNEKFFNRNHVIDIVLKKMLILFHISSTFIQTSFFITTKFTSFKSLNLMFCLRRAYCVVFSMLTYDLMLENFRFSLYSLSFFNSIILIK